MCTIFIPQYPKIIKEKKELIEFDLKDLEFRSQVL
jgi:hypothetical protein